MFTRGEHRPNQPCLVGSITKYIPYVHLASTTDVIQMTNASRPYTLSLLCIIVNNIVNKNGMRTRPEYEYIKLVLHSSPLWRQLVQL